MSDKKTKRAGSTKSIGIRISPEFHELIKAVAAITGSDVGEAYMDAGREWLKKLSAGNSVVKGLIDQKCSGNPELRAFLSHKPSLLANRA